MCTSIPQMRVWMFSLTDLHPEAPTSIERFYFLSKPTLKDVKQAFACHNWSEELLESANKLLSKIDWDYAIRTIPVCLNNYGL